MVTSIAPRYGKKNPVVYISICSLVGSVSVMSIKGFGIAVKLTLSGSNQFSHPSTYVFMIVTAVCIMVQMNYFNKALDLFSTNVYVRASSGPCNWLTFACVASTRCTTSVSRPAQSSPPQSFSKVSTPQTQPTPYHSSSASSSYSLASISSTSPARPTTHHHHPQPPENTTTCLSNMVSLTRD